MSREIAVLDFGSQYSQLIVRKARELGYLARLHPPDALKTLIDPAAVILSGGPRSVTDPAAPDIDFNYLRLLGIPVLGICYGMQLSNLKWGGQVAPGTTREYGPAIIYPVDERTSGDNLLCRGVSSGSQIWMSHSDTVSELPPSARILARNGDGMPVALAWSDLWFGIQFHPEVTHSTEGKTILRNFLSLARNPAPFSVDDFREEIMQRIRDEVGDREVLCGVSGGVDSTVLAVLLKHAGVKLRPLFVDHGLLRQGEVAEVIANFRQFGMEIEVVDASARFLNALKGQPDPEKKRAIIGNMFIDVFFSAAGAKVELLAQGTLYPDVIESASSGSIASKIKTHHNRVDRILELKAEGKVIEPLAELFKDEVRALGRSLGIPEPILQRHPFPGPGLAVRCPGEVTEEKLAIIRQSDFIFMEELKAADWYDRTWQAYAVLIPVRTVGVKGDERSYEFPVGLRAVISEDAMTADWVELPYSLLRKVSNRILNEVKGVVRVLYDISTKPPASIEWE